jgi:negative regulator of sigma-B (phosphoserine phosphatase)
MLDAEWPETLERGVAESALDPVAGSGDLAVFAPYDGGALVAAVDGLGHGGAAAEAAETAAAVLAAHVDEPPDRLLERCHAALRRSRGAVMTLVWFDLKAGTLTWTGVGNVEARLVRVGAEEEQAQSPVILGGVVGYNLPRAHASTVSLHDGDVLVLATDGVQADFARSVSPDRPSQALAEDVLAAHGKDNDDALVVAVRYRGPAAG